jgi:hypothetical protein
VAIVLIYTGYADKLIELAAFFDFFIAFQKKIVSIVLFLDETRYAIRAPSVFI